MRVFRPRSTVAGVPYTPQECVLCKSFASGGRSLLARGAVAELRAEDPGPARDVLGWRTWFGDVHPSDAVRAERADVDVYELVVRIEPAADVVQRVAEAKQVRVVDARDVQVERAALLVIAAVRVSPVAAHDENGAPRKGLGNLLHRPDQPRMQQFYARQPLPAGGVFVRLQRQRHVWLGRCGRASQHAQAIERVGSDCPLAIDQRHARELRAVVTHDGYCAWQLPTRAKLALIDA